MKISKNTRRLYLLATLAASLAIAGCSDMGMNKSTTSTLALSGAQEVPPVTTLATGVSTVTIGSDKSVSGTITASGMVPTMAHIHMSAGGPGTNGPVIVPATKTAENVFTFPANARLTDEQYTAYRDGKLYVNVHSAAYPGGEIRAQLK